MENERYYQVIGEGVSEGGRYRRGLILAGLLGSMLGLFGSLASTYLAFVI
ncbi:MAG: hypothetical protein ACFFEA_13490 [Candidatus Thorarchaeota archaeon]